METTLSDNIRSYRKERKLTQEQFAEILGVTSGAVYKWEAGLSVPELDMIMSMADLFGCSVDALLGYRMKDSRLDSAVERIEEYLKVRDRRALEEAESVIIRYPNSFEAISHAISAYFILGASAHNEQDLRRALELYERAVVLLPQNRDPRVTEQTLYGEMAEISILLGEREKGIEVLKQHNGGGEFSATIGLFLATEMGRYEEARPFLQESFFRGLNELINSVMGSASILINTGESGNAAGLIRWMIALLEGISEDERPDFLFRIRAEMFMLLALAELKNGNEEEAVRMLRQSAELAGRFDRDPDYGITSIRYIQMNITRIADSLGETAHDALQRLVDLADDAGLSDMWKEITENGKE